MKAVFVLPLALGLAVPFVSIDPAVAGGREGVSKTYTYKGARSHRSYKRKRVRRVRRAKPQVRGFRLRVGGYSFRRRDSLRHEHNSPPPSDFGGRYLDVSPSPNGIIPTGPYN